MKILIIGSGKPTSLGALIRRELSQYEVVLASRHADRKLGVRQCDITNPRSVRSALRRLRPDCLILAAGLYPKPAPLGNLQEWDVIRGHIASKTTGMLVAMDACARFDTPRLITLCGSLTCSDPRLAFFPLVNASVWAGVQFLAQHTRTHATYLELGPIPGSTMGDRYIRKAESALKAKAFKHTTIEQLAATIRDILAGKHPSGSLIKV